MRPLIGIPPCLDDRGRWRPGRRYHYLDAAYAEALSVAGAVAVVVPPQRDPDAIVERLDGLLLPGGDDFLPDRAYPADVSFDPVPETQRAFDAQLLDAALRRGLPLLAICYGMQLLALHCGGALHFDLPTDLPDASPHRLPEPDGRHPISLAAGSHLAAILDDRSLQVNSLHHQAVADPGRGARVVGRSPDGVIEAIEAKGDGFAIGVQWHPEKMDAPHRDRLFGALVQASRSRSSAVGSG
jgi:putative glutamine amidotransferase